MDGLQDRASSGVNDSGTCAGSDTPLTQRRSRRVRGRVPAKALRKMERGQIYFVRAGDTVKIGFTTATTSRIKALQTSNAATLELLGTTPGTEQDERRLHAQFQHLHLRGEWFTVGEDLMAHIERNTEQGIAAAKARATEARKRPRRQSSPEVRALLMMRRKVGYNTPAGHRISNIDEILQNRETATGDQLRELDANLAIQISGLEQLTS